MSCVGKENDASHTITTISSSTQNKILRQLLSFKNAYSNSPPEAMVGTVEKLNLQKTFDFITPAYEHPVKCQHQQYSSITFSNWIKEDIVYFNNLLNILFYYFANSSNDKYWN